MELDKIRKRVAEFAEYGELEMMVQYVNDVRAVQKRLVDAQENINFINQVGIGLQSDCDNATHLE